MRSDSRSDTVPRPQRGDRARGCTRASAPSPDDVGERRGRTPALRGRAQGEDACFFDHVDAEAISEPACLSQVIAVGLRTGSYGNCMVNGIAKPEVKLAGGGPISFRIAEVTALVASLLEADPTMDIAQVRQKVLDLQPQ